MRAWTLFGLLIATAAAAAAPDVGPSFAAALPEAVVDVTGWERVTGEFETATARGTYLFHVNPQRQAMYQVMRYRVELLSPTTDLQRRRRPSERVAFVRAPGAREPMLCWERAVAGASPSWRALVSETGEYKLEMGVLMQVLAVHQALRGSQLQPAP